MATDRCLGRIVRNDPKGVWMLPLEGAGDYWFHIPIRCEKRMIQDGLCEMCIAKARRTEERVRETGGAAIKRGLLSGMLHGRVGDPVPAWSRMFGGEWYNLKIAAGCRVSEETMGRAKHAVEAAEGAGAAPVPAVEVEPKRRGRKPKAVAEVATKAAAPPPVEKPKRVQTKLSIAELRKAATEAKAKEGDVPPAPVVAVPAAAPAPPPIKKRGAPKQTGVATGTAVAAVATAYVEDTHPAPVEDVAVVSVRRVELPDGRSCYWDPVTQKLYDKAFKTIGRYSVETGEVLRGSDSEH